MNENEIMKDEIIDSECEQIRFALFNCEPLMEKQQKHIEECESCRTFIKQADILLSDLNELGKDFNFDSENIGVCDRVMEEIKRQEVFAGKRTSKANPFLKHSGLIAACLVIAIMALPILRGTFLAGSKNEEAVMFDAAEAEMSQYSDNEADRSGEPYGTLPVNEAGNGANIYFKESAQEYVSETEDFRESEFDYSTEDSVNDVSDGNMYMYSYSSGSVVVQDEENIILKNTKDYKTSGSGSSAPEKTVNDGIQAESHIDRVDIYAVLNEYILKVLNEGESYDETFEIVYDSEIKAHTEVIISDERILKLVLQKTGDLWEVTQAEMIFAE